MSEPNHKHCGCNVCCRCGEDTSAAKATAPARPLLTRESLAMVVLKHIVRREGGLIPTAARIADAILAHLADPPAQPQVEQPASEPAAPRADAGDDAFAITLLAAFDAATNQPISEDWTDCNEAARKGWRASAAKARELLGAEAAKWKAEAVATRIASQQTVNALSAIIVARDDEIARMQGQATVSWLPAVGDPVETFDATGWTPHVVCGRDVTGKEHRRGHGVELFEVLGRERKYFADEENDFWRRVANATKGEAP